MTKVRLPGVAQGLHPTILLIMYVMLGSELEARGVQPGELQCNHTGGTQYETSFSKPIRETLNSGSCSRRIGNGRVRFGRVETFV